VETESFASGFDTLVTDILSMSVVIELLKSIADYFEIHRIKLTTMSTRRWYSWCAR
jgi:uncharacterized membrane protein (DUF373 family)